MANPQPPPPPGAHAGAAPPPGVVAAPPPPIALPGFAPPPQVPHFVATAPPPAPMALVPAQPVAGYGATPVPNMCPPGPQPRRGKTNCFEAKHIFFENWNVETMLKQSFWRNLNEFNLGTLPGVHHSPWLPCSGTAVPKQPAKAAAQPTGHKPRAATSGKVTAPTMAALPEDTMNEVLSGFNPTQFNDISLRNYSILDKSELALVFPYVQNSYVHKVLVVYFSGWGFVESHTPDL